MIRLNQSHSDQPKRILDRVFQRVLTVSTAAACVAVLTAPKSADAVTFDLFLIATPTVAGPSSAPFSATLSDVFQLDINFTNSNGPTATGFSNVTDTFTFDVDQSLSFANDVTTGAGVDPHDAGEPGEGTAARYDSQAGTWDDVGIANTNEEDDPEYNIDFGRNASVIFDQVAGGYTELLIAEDGGFNPFDMYLCDDIDCNTSEKIFNGFNRLLGVALDGLDFFTASDSTDATEVDQAFLFRFDAPITQFLKITEDDDRSANGIYRDSQRLELDFIGVGETVSAVPGPAGLPLLLSGLGVFVWARRRKPA